MKRPPVVLAIGLADDTLVAGTAGLRAEWGALGIEAPGDGRSFRALFHRTDASFRRLDRASRALVLAAEAAGLDAVLPADARDDTAIIVETERGSLEADLQFAASLEPGPAHGAVFVYTLPSASLGEVALRHRLRGPAVCLSIGGDPSGEAGSETRGEMRGEALREAARLIEDGEARFALAASVEALSSPRGSLTPALRAVVALLAAPDAATAAAALAVAVAPWPDGPDPFAELAERARAHGGIRP